MLPGLPSSLSEPSRLFTIIGRDNDELKKPIYSPRLANTSPSVSAPWTSGLACCVVCAHVITLLTEREKRGGEWQRLNGFNPEEEERIREERQGRDWAVVHPSVYRGVLIEVSWRNSAQALFFFLAFDLTWSQDSSPGNGLPFANVFFTEALPSCQVRRKSWRR